MALRASTTAGLWLLGFIVGVRALDCNPGAYFDGAKCSLCPGGTYGDRPGLTSPLCSGPCAGGYFCPEGSTSAKQQVCGRSVYYCPPGSATRMPVTEGYYTTLSSSDPNYASPLSSTSSARRNAAAAQTKCEPGYYCAFGIRHPCSAGLFGEVYGLESAACTRSCPLGFYCPLATPHPIPCPPGTFGQDLGLKDAACSGLCPPGYYWCVSSRPKSCCAQLTSALAPMCAARAVPWFLSRVQQELSGMPMDSRQPHARRSAPKSAPEHHSRLCVSRLRAQLATSARSRPLSRFRAAPSTCSAPPDHPHRRPSPVASTRHGHRSH